MNFLWMRFSMWTAEWAALPRRWRAYRDLMRADEKWRTEFQGWVRQLGVHAQFDMQNACAIARRCVGAEIALQRLADATERELEAAELPKLTAAEVERLAMLAEACGDVAKAIGKVLRHGWESQSPYGSKTNRVALEREIGDLRAVVGMMLDVRDLRLGDVRHWQRRKRENAAKWTHHQADSMPRVEQLAMMEAIAAERGIEQ